MRTASALRALTVVLSLVVPSLSLAQAGGNPGVVTGNTTLPPMDTNFTDVAFRFVAKQSVKVAKASVYVDAYDTSWSSTSFSTFNVFIAQDNQGKPGATVGSAGTIDADATGWISGTLPNVQLTAGTMYYLVFETPSSGFKNKTGPKLRALTPALDYDPQTGEPNSRALFKKNGANWSVVAGDTGIFLLQTVEADPWAATPPCTGTGDGEGVIGNPYVDATDISFGVADGPVSQRFFVPSDTYIDRIDVLLSGTGAVSGQLMADGNSTPLATGTLTKGTAGPSGTNWFSLAIPDSLKLSAGAPPATVRYRVRLNSVGTYQWAGATVDDGSMAGTGGCSPYVRATFSGYQGRVFEFPVAGGTVEVNAADLFFKLNKCSAKVWYRDADKDGYGDSNDTVTSCVQPTGYVAQSGDCDDAKGAVHPMATETCNGIDDDCDGTPDDGNPGGGATCTTGKSGVCAAGTQTCSGGKLQCVQNKSASTETCNGLDDDCNGIPDDVAANSLPACAKQKGVCQGTHQGCVSGKLTECDYTTLADYEATETRCDGKDNDCNGVPDDVPASTCADTDPCTADSCTAAKCVHLPGPDDVACDDGSACTEMDVCKAGKCGGKLLPTPECSLDQGVSQFTADRPSAPADGATAITLTAKLLAKGGMPLPGTVEFACSLGTLSEAHRDGTAWVATLTSKQEGASECTAAANGSIAFATKVRVVFTPLTELKLAVDPAALTLSPGESQAVKVTLKGGAVSSAATLAVFGLQGLSVTGAKLGSADLVVSPEESGAAIALADLPDGAAIDVTLTAADDASGSTTVGVLTRQGTQAISNDASIEVKFQEQVSLGGGCGCSSAATPSLLGALPLLAFALRRRRR